MLGYAITLVVLIGVQPLGIWAFRYIKNKRIFTVIFPWLIFVGYICCVISMGIKNGVRDWNFLNALPTANVSPFMYCLTPFMFLFPEKIRKYLFGLTALLSFGLICAGCITCLFNIWRSYSFHWEFAVDTMAHGALSLFGVYLIQSEQTDLKIKTCLIGGSIIVGVAVMMLVLNLVLHTSFFGLSLYGQHNIYNAVLCKSGYLSAALYFIGLCGVLALGAGYQTLISKTKNKSRK